MSLSALCRYQLLSVRALESDGIVCGVVIFVVPEQRSERRVSLEAFRLHLNAHHIFTLY